MLVYFIFSAFQHRIIYYSSHFVTNLLCSTSKVCFIGLRIEVFEQICYLWQRPPMMAFEEAACTFLPISLTSSPVYLQVERIQSAIGLRLA